MPVVDSIEQLNELLAAANAKDDHRRIGNRTTTVGHDWEFEQETLRQLPSEVFPTWLTLTTRVDRYARVTIGLRGGSAGSMRAERVARSLVSLMLSGCSGI